MHRLTAVFFVVGTMACVHAAEPGEKQPKITIDADELNTKYQVRGPLGVPLGEVVTAVGQTVMSRSKDADTMFRVDSVNNQPLRQPVTMHYRLSNGMHLKTGNTYWIHAYQNGSYEGIPSQATDESGVAQTKPYRFVVRLIVIKRQNPDEPTSAVSF